jgi:hypothetical protein
VRRAIVCLAAVLALAGCTGDDHTPQARVSQSESPTPSPVIPSTKPVVQVPKGPPPTKLVTRDLIVGTGDFALPGKSVSVNYVGVLYDGGKEFDSSWGPGKHPLNFQVGGEQVIPGWDEGIVGMRVGGRRELVIPPDMAYGEQGFGSVIPPNATLVFVVDLVDAGGVVGAPASP